MSKSFSSILFGQKSVSCSQTQIDINSQCTATKEKVKAKMMSSLMYTCNIDADVKQNSHKETKMIFEIHLSFNAVIVKTEK